MHTLKKGGNTVMVHIRTLRKKLGEDKRKKQVDQNRLGSWVHIQWVEY